jgi:signal transduction histidine kinase
LRTRRAWRRLSGAGIPAEAQPHIFDRFYRADSARLRDKDDSAGPASGAGLGLSIARWVAEAHGGTLELLHSSETGTVFKLILPAPEGRVKNVPPK